MRLCILLSCLAVCGCTASVKFIDRTNGEIYVGKTGGTFRGEGSINAKIEDKAYSGDWFYSQIGGGYSLGSAVGLAGGQSSFATGTAIGLSAQGQGLITMRDGNGSYVRCVFNFNTFSNHGLGECLRNDGRQYDLTLKR